MTQQPNLFQADKPVLPPLPTNPEPQSRSPRRVPRWLQYIELSVRVIVRVYLGLILVALPWTHFWGDNRLLLFLPHLSTFALNGITRGIVSGLGLLNIWIGIHDLWTALYNAIRHKKG